jgi:hypothetical protein
MACPAAFTITDGTTTVTVSLGSLAEGYSIAREVIADGLSIFRSAAGTASLDVLWEKRRYTITGTGPADPVLYGLLLTATSWTVTIPGFADGSGSETWVVVPARPTQTKDRLTGSHSWTLVLEQAN